MTDFADMAEEIEQADRDRSLAGIVRYQGVSATECVDCGGDILEARRKAVPGCQTCRECAEILERRR